MSAMVCSRGESLTHHISQMKLFNAIAAAVVIGTTSTLATAPAQAGCYPPLAAKVMVPIIRVSGNIPLATQAARDEGYLDVTEACTYRTISYINQYGHVIH